MDLQGLKYTLSILAIILAILSIVCYFSGRFFWFIAFGITAVLCKLAEIILRVRKKK